VRSGVDVSPAASLGSRVFLTTAGGKQDREQAKDG